MKKIVWCTTILFCFIWVAPLNSQTMTGGDFEILADAFSFSDSDEISGGDFSLTGSGGEFAQTSSGGSIDLRGGFQAQEAGILSFILSSTDISLGELSDGAVSSANVDVTVSTDSETGYTLSAVEDGNLRTGNGDIIADVADGEVTAGVAEYGIRTSGADGALATDTALSGTALTVASHTAIVDGRTTTVSFRASRTAGTAAGTYSHTVTFTLTVNPIRISR